MKKKDKEVWDLRRSHKCDCIKVELGLFLSMDDDDPGIPTEGDIGVCAVCAGWWKMVDGRPVPHIPAEHDVAAVIFKVYERRAPRDCYRWVN